MVKKNMLPFEFDKTRPTRVGVLPRYAEDASDIKWFEADGPGRMIFHTVNAWEEDGGETIQLFVCSMNDVS